MSDPRAIGLDVGTGYISSATKGDDTEEKKIRLRKVRDAFMRIDPDEFMAGNAPEFGEKMLKKTGTHYIKLDEVLYILGDSAYEMSIEMNRDLLRPMARGVLNPNEPESAIMVEELMKAVIGAPTNPADTVFYCVPANPIDADYDVDYHKATCEEAIRNIGYKNVSVMNEGLAVVYSELYENNFTGIGISCLTPEMPVITDKGLKPIGDFVGGERVLTRGGTFENVLEVVPSEKKEDILNIRFYGSNVPLRVTKDHEIYVRDENGLESWIEAQNLTEDYYVYSPAIKTKKKTSTINYINKKHKKNEKVTKEVHRDIAELVGLFLGDGHIERTRGAIFFNFSKEQKSSQCDFVKEIMEEKFGSSTSFIAKSENCIRTQTVNKGLQEWFERRCYKEENGNFVKTIPWKLDEMDRSVRTGLIRGLFKSDGYISSDAITFENTSSELTIGIMKMCQLEGIKGTFHERHRELNEHEIENGRKILNLRKTFTFVVVQEDISRLNDLLFKDGYSVTRVFSDNSQWNKIRNIEEEFYEGTVYDLKVENDHSFCLPNVCVHNCGAGMCNIAYANRGIEVMGFSISKGGDYIDQSAAKQVNDTVPVMTYRKEDGMDIRDPQDEYEKAIAVYYKNLIQYLVKSFGALYRKKDKKELPRLFKPIPLVVSGGTSLVGGFIEVLEKTIREEKDFPIKLGEIRHAEEPLYAVSAGLYQAAKLNADLG
jgi:intein/homing endonuclease